MNANISLTYRFYSGFMFESMLGTNFTNTGGEVYSGERSYAMTSIRGYEYGMYGPNNPLFKQSKLPFGGVLNTLSSNNVNYTWRNGLNYGHTFNKLHSVTALAGMEVRSNSYKVSNATIYGYLPDRGKTIIAPPSTIVDVFGTPVANGLYTNNAITSSLVENLSNYTSFYGTGSYSYDNRYSASISVRGDASNRFGQDERTRFKPIWAAGLRWNVANEKFFQRSDWFNDFSIRTSYGYQGNVAENFGPDLIMKIPSGTEAISTLTGEQIFTISNLPYTNLRWEKTQTMNVGFDFNFFKGRIGATVDYYVKHSKDLIVMKEVPYENGINQLPVNNGTLTNSGIDLTLNFIPIKTKNFTWSLGLSSSKNVNKITNRQGQNPTWNIAKSGTYLKEGYPVSSFWVFDFKGVDSATGVPLFNIPTASTNANVIFDASEFMKYAGKLNPDFTSGLSTSISYKTITVSSSAYLSVGGRKLLSPLYPVEMVRSTPNEYNNLSKYLINRWRKPGDNAITDIPSLPQSSVSYVDIPSGAIVFGNQAQSSIESPYSLYNFSSARVVNTTYLRINNINVSYTIPFHIMSRMSCKTATVGYSLGNLYTFVNKDYKGVDPEVASGSQPLPKIHSLNLSITF